jgi:hypothetical protein
MAGAPLFHRLYGDALARLPLPIVKLHDIAGPRTWYGQAEVRQGCSLAARLICGVLRFPAAAARVPLTVTMAPDGDGEIWRRAFGVHVMATTLRVGPLPGTVEERLWPFAATSRLDADATGVTQVLIGLSVLGAPLPRLLWPKLKVRESAEGARYRFSVEAAFPWGAPICQYQGWLETE